MDINALINMVTEGLPAEQAASVRAAIERDAVKTKVLTIKAQEEWQTLEQKAQELQQALDGGPDKPGAKEYVKWYNDNFTKVQQLQKEREAYEAKFGKLDGTPPTAPTAPPAGVMTEADIQRMVDARIQGQYAPQWSTLLTGTGKIVQKHMFAGRKTPIDFDEIGKLTTTKFNGNIEAAYDEWDRPEREKSEKEANEKEISRRVTEELQKRQATTQFPGSADLTPSSLSLRTKAETDKFDPAAMKQDLAQTFMRGTLPGDTTQ